MKTLIAVLIIFGLLIGFAVFSYSYIEKTTGILLTDARKIELNLKGKRWPQAQKDYETFQASWKKSSSIWTMLIDHRELDNINITLGRLKKLISVRNYAQSMAELGELQLLLKHIPESEALNLENVL